MKSCMSGDPPLNPNLHPSTHYLNCNTWSNPFYELSWDTIWIVIPQMKHNVTTENLPFNRYSGTSWLPICLDHLVVPAVSGCAARGCDRRLMTNILDIQSSGMEPPDLPASGWWPQITYCTIIFNVSALVFPCEIRYITQYIHFYSCHVFSLLQVEANG